MHQPVGALHALQGDRMCKRPRGNIRDPRAAQLGDGPGRADCRLRSLMFPRGRPQFSIAHAHSALTVGAPKPWDLSAARRVL